MEYKEIRKQRFELGKADGIANKPPAQLDRAYLEGYEEGRQGKAWVRAPKPCPHCGELP